MGRRPNAVPRKGITVTLTEETLKLLKQEVGARMAASGDSVTTSSVVEDLIQKHLRKDGVRSQRLKRKEEQVSIEFGTELDEIPKLG